MAAQPGSILDRYRVSGRFTAMANVFSLLPIVALDLWAFDLSPKRAVDVVVTAAVLVAAALLIVRETRRPYELQLVGEGLRWCSPFASGQIPLAAVTVIRSARAPRRVVVIELRDHPARAIRVRGGLTEFVDTMTRVHPDLPVRINERVLERGRRAPTLVPGLS